MQPAAKPLYPDNRIRRHLSELVRLATPVAINRTSIMMLATVDIIMLGRISANEVAYYSLGMSPFIVLMVTGIGLLFGTSVSTSHAIGEEDFKKAGAVWRNSIPHALLIGVFFLIISQFGEGFYRLTGQSEDLVNRSKNVLAIFGVSLVPTMIYITCAFFLEALKKPRPVMIISILANFLNIGGNYLLIYGTDFIPAMGAEGAALATALARAVMGFGLLIYIWFMKDHLLYAIRKRQPESWIKAGKLQRSYGYAAGLSFGMETFAFGVMNIFAGWMGATQLAIYGVSMNLLAMLFMVALGLSAATSIRVGIAHGRRDWPDRTLAGWVGLATTIAVLASLGTIVALWPDTWVKIYFDDADLIPLAIPVFLMIGAIMVADGIQVVMSQALRASADSWVPTIMAFVSYMVIMMPLGWFFGVYLNHGAFGLFEAIGCGSIMASVVLTLRWIWQSRKVRSASS